MVAIAAVAVSALGIAVASIVSNRDTARSTSGPPPMVSALTSGTAAAPPGRSQTPAPAADAPAPLIPGYRTVPIPDRGAAYDAPPEWQAAPQGTATWGNPPDVVELAGLTQEGKDYCPRSTRTNAFLTMSPQGDPAAAAADVGTRMASVGWPTATATAHGAAEPLTSLDGQLHGTFVATTGTAPPPEPGCADTFSVFAFAFASENGNFVMTIAADTGVPGAIDQATAQRILTSIRPLSQQ